MTPPIQPFPPRPGPPPKTAPRATTRVPRVFGIWGTIGYGISSIASITALLTMGFTGWTPPWWFLMPVLLYTFTSTGIICYGRIEANKDAKFYIETIKRQSAANEQRVMRKMK